MVQTAKKQDQHQGVARTAWNQCTIYILQVAPCFLASSFLPRLIANPEESVTQLFGMNGGFVCLLQTKTLIAHRGDIWLIKTQGARRLRKEG